GFVNEFVGRMNDDVSIGLSFLQPRDTADVIHVRVCAGDGLQLKVMLVDRFNNGFRVIARIDANRALAFLAAYDPRVLLEGGDGDFFDDHLSVVSGQWSVVSGNTKTADH